jgi:soluble lytic murein transglycosylase-like protein
VITTNARIQQTDPAHYFLRIAFLVPAFLFPSRRRRAISHRAWRRAGLCGGIAVAVSICCASTHAEPAVAPPKDLVSAADRIAIFVEEAAHRFGVPETWIRAVMRVESNDEIQAVSPKGALGLMQIMPQTWAGLRARYGLGVDPYDAHDNILAGAAYLRELWDRYGSPGFLAAYNAGPARYEDHLATGRPLPDETQAYVARLTPALAGGALDSVMFVASVAPSWTEAPLFTDHPTSVPARPDRHLGPSPAFVVNDPATAFAIRPNGLFVATSNWRSRP